MDTVDSVSLPLQGPIALDDTTASLEGADAGDSADLHEAYLAGVISRYQAEAERQFALAKVTILQNEGGAAKLAQQALSDAVNGFWWAEGRAEEESLHQLLHEIGRWKRLNVGCELKFDEEKGYTQTCLVAMAHRRMGLSIGFVAKRICSLCDEDLSECPHMRNRSYWVRGGAVANQPCRVCLQESCDHRSDYLYRAQVISVIKDANVREVSLVPRPANPGARILEVSISNSRLAELLGDEFEPGMGLNCDICLNDCPGFVELEWPAEP